MSFFLARRVFSVVSPTTILFKSSRVFPRFAVNKVSLYSTSATPDINVKDLLKREEFLVVRRKLEEIRKEQIPYAQYVRICEDSGLTREEASRLSKSLTDSGIIYHNPSSKDLLLSDSVLLKPHKLSSVIHGAYGNEVLFSGAKSLGEYQGMKAEFESLLVTKTMLDKKALAYANNWVVVCGMYLIIQGAVLARMVWWEFSWDIMEPITYFITFGTGIVGWIYFTVMKSEYTYQNLRDNLASRKRARLYKLHDFNEARFCQLEKIFRSNEKGEFLTKLA